MADTNYNIEIGATLNDEQLQKETSAALKKIQSDPNKAWVVTVRFDTHYMEKDMTEIQNKVKQQLKEVEKSFTMDVKLAGEGDTLKVQQDSLKNYISLLKERNKLEVDYAKIANNPQYNTSTMDSVKQSLQEVIQARKLEAEQLKKSITDKDLERQAIEATKKANDELNASLKKAEAQDSYKQDIQSLNKIISLLKERNKFETQLTKSSTRKTSNKDAILEQEPALRELILATNPQISTLQKNITNKEISAKASREIADADKQLAAQKANVVAASKNEDSWLKKVTSSMKDATARIFDYTIAYRAISGIEQIFRESINVAKELDSTMVDLQIVTGDTRDSVEGLMGTYNEMAKSLGSTTVSVAESANEFLRQGLSVEETNQMIEASQYLSKLGMIEASEATQYLTSATKGYQLSATEAMSVVDKLTKVDINAAVSSGYLAEAMARTANSAQQAGVDMDTLIGYIATIGETTQRSASTVGESLKTMFARLIYKARYIVKYSCKIFTKYLENLIRQATRWNNYKNINKIEYVA